ncbi:class I SAM-dependent methyltransferase [Hoeflea olei]|uniref:SAM-dependent methyltransferase n=1 Tax=Hoeflea olei TaxID=1480615 RepID=A0A1C1YTQ3_9HYPH|nr:class I SAM-dependent methyltransferase [Hoeflea olei]OCW56908.1 SAM-dependent methyltransferase [Hoeflea olei]
MEDLDAVSGKYLADKTVEIENDLMMNWYPKRIEARIGHVGSLLELGLGHGYTVPYFAAMTDHHEVVEGSPRVIAHFKANNPWYRGRLAEGYFETYTPERRFDVIVMGFVLEHVDDPRLILSRYRDFLAPGGKLYVAVPNAKSLNRRYGLEMGMIDDIYDLNATDHELGHKRNYCRDTLRADIEATGYRSTLEEGIYLKPLPLAVLKTLDDMEANLQAMLKVGVDFPDLCVALLFELEVADA